MGQKRLGVDPELGRLCDEAGVRWELTHKRRHVALLVEGRQVLVLPANQAATNNPGRARDNARCHLKRYLRSLQPCPA